MKKIIRTTFTFLGLMMATISFAQMKTEKIKVSGNCGMCKKHIEGALTKKDGVTKAFWNKETKVLTVTYDTKKITNDEIQKKVAAVGYDTPKYRGDDKAYNELDACCQYDRKDPLSIEKNDGHH